MNITNQASRAVISELLQDEIERCNNLIASLSGSTKTWGATVGSLITMDINTAQSAIDSNDSTAMFRALRALRLHGN